jgi:hypothetical protein
MKDFGYPIANWKNPEKYPNPDEDKNINWGWEFLRRNPDYQKDFDKFEKTKSFRTKLQIRKQWSFKNNLINPKLSKPRYLRFEILEYPRQIEIAEKSLRKISIRNPFREASDAGYIFNLNLPIKQQIRKVEKELTALQKFISFKGDIKIKDRIISFDGINLRKLPNKHKQKLIQYLRILDAINLGIKRPELLKTFYPAPHNFEAEPMDNLKKDIKAANDHSINYLSFFSI